jgi:hypothetical protein
MNAHRDARDDAIDLLELANPVDPMRIVDPHDLTSAHDRVRRMIVATAAEAPSPPARRQRPRLVVRFGVATVVAAAVVVIVAFAGGVGHTVPSASAMTIKRAAAALAPVPGTIVHFDFTGTSSYTDGHSWTWTQDCWEQQGTNNSVVVNQAYPDAPAGTETAQVGTQEEIYDPATDTIYESEPAAAPANPGPNPSSSSDPSAFTGQIQRQLAVGNARVIGPATIDGQHAIEIVAPAGTYYVRADGTDAPIELIYHDPAGPGSTTTLVFHIYELLGAAGNESLLSLTARHPQARVDVSTADFRAALNHRLPNG